MSSGFDPLKYGSQVYDKVTALSSVKQLLFEVGLCEILVFLAAVDEDTSRLAAYCQALVVIRPTDNAESPSKTAVETARHAVDKLIPDDDDTDGRQWTPLWQNAGISLYYTYGMVVGDQQSGFALTHYIEAVDYIIQATSGLNVPLPHIELQPFMQNACEIVADMIQMLESTSVSRDSVAEYYARVRRAANSLASKIKDLRDRANRGVKPTIAVDVEANATSAAVAYTEGEGVVNNESSGVSDGGPTAGAPPSR